MSDRFVTVQQWTITLQFRVVVFVGHREVYKVAVYARVRRAVQATA